MVAFLQRTFTSLVHAHTGFTQLRSLSLTAAASQLASLLAKAEANEISYLEFVQTLAEHELIQRNVNRIQRHFKQAQFPSEKRLDQFDYRHQTTFTKRQISGLLDFSFIVSALKSAPL